MVQVTIIEFGLLVFGIAFVVSFTVFFVLFNYLFNREDGSDSKRTDKIKKKSLDEDIISKILQETETMSIPFDLYDNNGMRLQIMIDNIKNDIRNTEDDSKLRNHVDSFTNEFNEFILFLESQNALLSNLIYDIVFNWLAKLNSPNS